MWLEGYEDYPAIADDATKDSIHIAPFRYVKASPFLHYDYELDAIEVLIPLIPAIVNFEPETLNLMSNGRWVTTYTELPKGYSVGDIEIGTIILNGKVPAEKRPVEIGDHDGDGIEDLMVKFDRNSVKQILEKGNEVKVTIEGKLSDGTPFKGHDYVRVISPGKAREVKGKGR